MSDKSIEFKDTVLEFDTPEEMREFLRQIENIFMASVCFVTYWKSLFEKTHRMRKDK